MGFTPSKYQVDIYNEFDNTTNNLLISAVAGSGKSTTLLKLIERTHAQVAFLAFNKSIQTEISQKVGENPAVDVLTIHSMGMKALMRHFRKRIDVKSSKIWDFTNKLNKQWKIPKKEYLQTVLGVQSLVDIYRLTMCNSVDDLEIAADELGLMYTPKEVDYAMDVIEEYKEYNKSPDVIDFVDMIYIPATNKNIELTIRPKLVFIDECQDLNACQHALIDRLIKKNNARFVACGDPYQSIYGFAGAHSESFQQFLDKDNVKEMPLSICYRCPTRVVDQANKVHDIMEPFEARGTGVVRTGFVEEVEEGDMVICRNVKPLISTYFQLLAKGKKATIKGKDLGTGLIKLIKPFQYQSSGHLLVSLQGKLQHKRDELIERGIDNPTSHPSYINLEEKMDVIEFVAQQYATTKQMIDFFEDIFADNDKVGVILSTIHKSKGLENPNVFLLDRHLIPSKFAKSDDQKAQERNLLYVAITRAQEKLIYIKSQVKSKVKKQVENG